MVAYAAHPRETAQAIRAFGCTVVAGNMEQQLGAGATDCGCGFEDGTACDVMAGAWFAHASSAMTKDLRDWMAGCPEIVTFTHKGKHESARVAVIHGGATDIARFVWPVSPEAAFVEEWRAVEARVGAVNIIISGHCWIHFTRR